MFYTHRFHHKSFFLSASRQTQVPEENRAAMTEEKKKGAATESTTFGIWYIMRPLSQDHSRYVFKKMN